MAMQVYREIEADMNKEYSQGFKNIIEFGDVLEDELISILPFMGLSPYTLSEEFQAKSSNGMSFVCVTPELNEVYQKFKGKNTVRNINNVLTTCESSINYTIWLDKKKYITKEYDLFHFLPRVREFIDTENVIVWEKIIPLNSFTPEKVKDIIEKNILKFLWDIGKAISGLHYNDIYHGDTRVDNIGIKDGNFVLFDFDSSKKITPENYTHGYANMMKDYNDFIVSIKFNLNEGGNPMRFNNISKFIPDITSYMFSFMQNSKIFKHVQNSVSNPITVEEMIKIIETSEIVL
jgi:serine/threonine protein kinase